MQTNIEQHSAYIGNNSIHPVWPLCSNKACFIMRVFFLRLDFRNKTSSIITLQVVSRQAAAGDILLEPVLTSCCQAIHWIAHSVFEFLLQVYIRIYRSLKPSNRANTTPTQAITFSPWDFLHSIKVRGLDGAQCLYVCLFEIVLRRTIIFYPTK